MDNPIEPDRPASQTTTDDGSSPVVSLHRARVGFAGQIEAALRMQGMTQADLARRLGRGRTLVSQALSRRSNLTLRTMVRFADACGCELRITLWPSADRCRTDVRKP